MCNISFIKVVSKKCNVNLFCSDFKVNDIFVYGSFYALMQEIRPGIEKLINDASNSGAIIFDGQISIFHILKICQS